MCQECDDWRLQKGATNSWSNAEEEAASDYLQFSKHTFSISRTKKVAAENNWTVVLIWNELVIKNSCIDKKYTADYRVVLDG